MACGSCGGTWTTNAPSTAQVGGKTLYAVVTENGEGRVAYQSHKLNLVVEVAGRYVGSAILPAPSLEDLVAAGGENLSHLAAVTVVTQVSESDTAETESVTEPEPTTSKRSRKSSES